MKLTRNIGPLARVAYVAFGLGLIVVALRAPFLPGAVALVLGAAGGVVVIEGTVGF